MPCEDRLFQKWMRWQIEMSLKVDGKSVILDEDEEIRTFSEFVDKLWFKYHYYII